MTSSRRKFLWSSLLLMAAFFGNTALLAQEVRIRGEVVRSSGETIPGATVYLYVTGQTDTLRLVTGERGQFERSLKAGRNYQIRITHLGFEKLEQRVELTRAIQGVLEERYVMQVAAGMLETVTLESQKVQIKEDTVTYKVDSTMYRQNDNIESMLKNLPGVQVDKDGTVTAQGKQVTRVKVNGKDFFGGDVTTATRELNADMVDRVQFIDDYGDQAAFTGIKDGDPSKTMNIILRKDKNKGYFGNVAAGAGTDARYLTSLSLNRFDNEQQISVLGNMNNTNTSQFNFGSGGGGGNGGIGSIIGSTMRAMGVGRGGGGVGAAVGNLSNPDGISLTRSAGVNYRDAWGSKTSVYGSYSMSNRGTNVIRSTVQQNIFEGTTSSFTQQSDAYSENTNHRFTFNVEYRPDSLNYIKFSPSVTYNRGYSDSYADFVNAFNGRESFGNTVNVGTSKTPNLNGTLLYNHRFKKRGRTVSLNLSGGRSSTDTDDESDNFNYFPTPVGDTSLFRLLQHIVQDNRSENYSARISYTEPLSSTRNLELNYSHSYQFQDNDRRNYDINPQTGEERFMDSASNIYDNTYRFNRVGVNLRTTLKKYNYTIGMSVQPATITTRSYTGNSVFRNPIINYFPVVRFAYNFSRSRSLNINYNGSTNQPSNAQLQPVVDLSNPQFISIGNPALRPEFTNTLSVRYNNFNFISGDVFFGNLSASVTGDKIVSSVRQLRGGVQETRYENASGFFTIFGFYNISKPIQNRKFVFNLGGNATFNNNISLVRDSLDRSSRNVGQNWVLGQRFSTDIRIKKWLETNVTVNYSMNRTRYSLAEELNNLTQTWTLSHSARIFLPKNFILSYEADKYLNLGFASDATANPLIINATLEKQLLKKKNLSLKLQGFDLLNQNIGVSRSVTSTGITDTRTNRLGRYFLFSFVCRINRFNASGQDTPMMDPGRGEMRNFRMPGL